MTTDLVRMEKINLVRKYNLPETYSCRCPYCAKYKGMLIRANGEKYNKNDRRKYYIYKHGDKGAQHINPTPLHIARWAIQTMTKPEDWVCDPFTGCGTTAVEAINHNRFFIGTELETAQLAKDNVYVQGANGHRAAIYKSDARYIDTIINTYPKLQLSIWHPPYSGDEQSNAKYNRDYENNLAFMKESDAYWDVIYNVMRQVVNHTLKGGYAVIGVKEMMRNKKWFDLHIKFSNIMKHMLNMTYKGMVLLPHYPRTLHLNTYYKRWGVHPSYYQTITIFRKEWV